MAVEEVISNMSDLVLVLPSGALGRFESLITIFKAVGIVVFVYIVYLLVRGFFTLKRIKRMRHIEKKVDAIDKKLDMLLKDKKKKK